MVTQSASPAHQQGAATVVALTGGENAVTSRVVLGLLAGFAFGASNAEAQQYPARSIRLLVTYAAGGGTDAIARLVAHGVSQKLGQTMVIENNGAAGGNVATSRRPAPLPMVTRC